MMSRCLPLPLGIAVAGAVLGATASQSPVGAVGRPVPLVRGSTRGPAHLQFSRDGRILYVAEADSGTVAVITTATRQVARRFFTGGEQPSGLAVLPSTELVVSHRFSGLVARCDAATGRRTRGVVLPGEPTRVTADREGKRLFVSLGQLDQIAVLDAETLRERGRIAVGRRPQALTLTPDGTRLLVANFQGGDVSVVDVATLRERERIPVTGVNLRGIAMAPGGTRAFVTGQIPANTRVTRDPLDMWTNTVFVLNLNEPAGKRSAEGWIDFAGAPSPDPDGVVALGEERVAVAIAGADALLRIRTPGPHLRTYDPVIEARQPTGLQPGALALSPDGRELWVANSLSSSVSVYDAARLTPIGVVDLGRATVRDDVRLAGRRLFGSADLTAGGQFTCNSCHPDGKSDGLTWQFVHVPDGLARRNTRSLRGGVTRTSPFRWSGLETDIEVFFQEEISGLLQGPRLTHPPLHALWMLLDQFPLPPNPYRTAAGTLTPAAVRGKGLFQGKAGCAGCHQGELWGGIGRKAWVGTTPPSVPLDVPHLHGVYDSGPYLHDGRANNLEEIFTQHNEQRRHGEAHRLTPAELHDVLRFVREL